MKVSPHSSVFREPLFQQWFTSGGEEKKNGHWHTETAGNHLPEWKWNGIPW
jgi:hypothetical protein